MNEIITNRLHIKGLSLYQLKNRLVSPQLLENEIGWTFSQRNLTKPERRAVAIKIKKMQASLPENHPWYTFWLISRIQDLKVVGMIGFKGIPDETGEVEIGYGICPQHQNMGYATEAAKAMLGWAFQQPSCISVIAVTDRTNLASQRVLIKIGMQVVQETTLSRTWRLNIKRS